MKNKSVVQRIKKVVSNIMHIRWKINYKKLISFKIDEYYKQIDREVVRI
jgi:hypothetical protein